jgi:hypothetical protein
MMTDTATQLFAAFESRPVKEQHELLVAMLRRSGELPDTLVSDNQFVGIADELFQAMDAGESNGDDGGSR